MHFLHIVAGEKPTSGEHAARVAAAKPAKSDRRLGQGQSDRLQLETLDGVDAVPARRALAGGQQLIENQIRPIAIGRNNWLFAGSLSR